MKASFLDTQPQQPQTRLAPLNATAPPALGNTYFAARTLNGTAVQNGLMMMTTLGPHGAVAASPTAQRLTQVNGMLTSLPAELKQDVTARRMGDESRLLEVRDLALKVERHLSLEVKRRAEADKALQLLVEQRMTEIATNVEKSATEKMTKMQMNIDILTKTIGELRAEIQAERERTARLAAELRHAAEHSVSDLKSALEQEKVSRLEKEAQIQVKLAQDILKAQERDEMERKQRETAVTEVREEFAKLMSEREKVDNRFRAKIVDDIACLRTALEMETEAREGANEQIAHTIDSVVGQIQTSLKIVSQN